MGFSAVVQLAAGGGGLMVGSPGYADPHYIRPGLISKKSDVYGFGVLLLAMITGVMAFRPKERRLLAVEVRPPLAEGRVGDFVDPRLGGEHDREEAEGLAACLHWGAAELAVVHDGGGEGHGRRCHRRRS